MVFAALAYKSLQTKPTRLNFDGTDLRVRAKLEILIEGYRKGGTPDTALSTVADRGQGLFSLSGFEKLD
jgi:hypothetical protein